MLVFIDESGDPGLKMNSGSSRFFTIALVVFEDYDEATNCDRRIELLKKELSWSDNSEFHFKKNSLRVRDSFFKAVMPYNFFYYGIVINKDPNKLYGEGFKNKSSFYKYACSLVFENAKDKLSKSIVVIDKNGNNEFRNQLAKYLRRKMNIDKKKIRKVKMQKSESNNLLQLVDYVAGAINRSIVNSRKDSQVFRKMLSRKEMYVQVWPKKE
ncbi:DUF3800 domain-containing protein [Patescibacteria group bacterium]|nr:DUF3800 domain-containing protein [Patescibacteria group bacterium]